jgi:hypothetical protein
MSSQPDVRKWTAYKHKSWHAARLAVLMLAGASAAVYVMFHDPGGYCMVERAGAFGIRLIMRSLA